MLTDSLQDQISRLLVLDDQIQRIEQRITEWRRGDEACLRISEIPGVGLLTATAAVAVIGNAQAFRSGRELAAFRVGAATERLGRQGEVGWPQQTWRRVLTHTADPRRPICHLQFETSA